MKLNLIVSCTLDDMFKDTFEVPGEQEYMRSLSDGKLIVTDNKTYERNRDSFGCSPVITMDDAGSMLAAARLMGSVMDIAKKKGYEEMFIVGDVYLSRAVLDQADAVYITIVGERDRFGEPFRFDHDDKRFERTGMVTPIMEGPARTRTIYERKAEDSKMTA